jgi:tetratricopeptide (TPR) repeat protein
VSRGCVAANAPRNVGRNDPCPCSSGRRFKHCCGAAQPRAAQQGGTGEACAEAKQTLQEKAIAAKRLWDAGRWADSVPILLEIVRFDPNTPHVHRDLGIAYQRCGRLEEANATLRRALHLQAGRGKALPHLNLAQAFADLAHALEEEGRDQIAAVTYRDAAKASENAANSDRYLAFALILEGKPDQAEAAVRRLLAEAPERVESRLLLGHVLSQLGRFAEAAEQLTQAIELAPERPLAFEALTTAKRMTEADRPLIDRIRAIAERPHLNPSLSIALDFGLGKAFDDLGDPAAAMRHYDAANRLKATSLRLDRDNLVSHYDDLISFFTAPRLDYAARAMARAMGPSDARPVFIVGMPRSGSTLVEQVLSSHPAVAAGGELTFWNDCIDRWHAAGERRPEAFAITLAVQEYSCLLSRIAPEAARVTDKALPNFALLWVIRIALPHARIIHCRRHPVDTCLSIYFTNFRARHDYAWDRGDIVFYYRQYQRLMEHWRRVIRPDRFTEVEYERLIADRGAQTRRLVEFCGLDWDDACLMPERNTRVVNTASWWQVRQPVYTTSVERWRRYEPWLGELRDLLPAEPDSGSTGGLAG